MNRGLKQSKLESSQIPESLLHAMPRLTLWSKRRIDNSLCWACLPRAGLGNKLAVWGRTVVFARKYGLRMFTTGLNRIRVGPVLRGETGRFYFNQFQSGSEVSFSESFRGRLILPREFNPSAKVDDDRRRLYVFSEIPGWQDFFLHLRNHRALILHEIWRFVSEQSVREIEAIQAPVISLHVRHGDFRELRPGEDFARVGAVRTPLSYFVAGVNLAREIAGWDVPVTLFSDGDDEDLLPLLRLPNLTRAPLRSAIVDLLSMSKSRVILASAGSTFGYWAAFLSDAVILLHPQHIPSAIRPDDINRLVFEGPMPNYAEEASPILTSNLRSLCRGSE